MRFYSEKAGMADNVQRGTLQQVICKVRFFPVADFAPLPWYFLRHFSIDRKTGCWVWRGAKARNPRYPQHLYGIYTINPKQSETGQKYTVTAHSYVYRRYHGPLGDGLEVDHTCENKLCVNPKHLEAVTRSENMLRYFRRRRQSC